MEKLSLSKIASLQKQREIREASSRDKTAPSPPPPLVFPPGGGGSRRNAPQNETYKIFYSVRSDSAPLRYKPEGRGFISL